MRYGDGKRWEEVLCFFAPHMDALPLYDALARRIWAELGAVTVRVLKSQISFSNRYNFAFVSFLPVKKAAQRPKPYITVSFGLDHRVEHPRIAAATEAYPNRWTHHVLVGSAEEIDEDLMEWIRQAAAFSQSKR